MPYLPTLQAFLEQSSLLLEAYPDDTRITTKYSYPSHLPSSSTKSSSKKASKTANASTETPADSQTPAAATAPIATLTFKTYNPATGICLKYRTNKAAEVGRLISGLGKLASGAKISDLTTATTTTTAAATATAAAATTGDVEMTDVPATADETAEVTTTAAKADAGGKGGKAKKKSGKGKR
ncbi:hypothetical protein VTN77DRAFT_3767 [Rasamsonia byssochlamydoides]|uniref:uncharacterized protein n=1 Tax=Rasamsonia byssochlamydoides TaxID=89139 RepID=UPI003743DCC5